MNKLTDETAIKQLRDLGWKVREPSYDALPLVNTSNFDDFAYSSLTGIAFYLTETRIILDTYGDNHHERREFMRSLHLENNLLGVWVDNHSKLRINKMKDSEFSAESLINDLVLLGDERWKDAKKIYDQKIARRRADYNSFSLDEKIECVQRFDAATYQLLEALR